MTTKHADAIGYLDELSTEINEGWFFLICEMIIVHGATKIDEPILPILITLLKGKASYFKRSLPAAKTLTPASLQTDFLEKLTEYSNFKRLSASLELTLSKQITIVFGSNGSGKSSICESMKVLANTEAPIRPLHNVLGKSGTRTEFKYKLRSEPTEHPWSLSTGYGIRASIIKYFDSSIALRNITSPIQAGRVIEIAPFKLHTFEIIKVALNQLREVIAKKIMLDEAKLAEALEKVRIQFAAFSPFPLSTISPTSIADLDAAIKTGEEFKKGSDLNDKQALLKELDKTASEDGMKLLRVEHGELLNLIGNIKEFSENVEKFWQLDSEKNTSQLKSKLAERDAFAKSLLPEGGTLQQLLSLIHATAPLLNLASPDERPCVLCRRELTEKEVELFKKYHALTENELGKEISILEQALAEAEKILQKISTARPTEWKGLSTISADITKEIEAKGLAIIRNCEMGKTPPDNAGNDLLTLKKIQVKLEGDLKQKVEAIKKASEGKAEVDKQMALLKKELQSLSYEQATMNHCAELKEIKIIANRLEWWRKNGPDFTGIQRKLTEAAKKAHEELVVTDFEDRLNAEYLEMAEQPMAAFGIKLMQKGSEGSVTVLPQVGGSHIQHILSDGEQKLHALALFFAELESCPQPIVIFDDPISSFDYNYTGNFCTRLSKFAEAHPTRQVIVLTHNWEFFAQLQQTLKRKHLGEKFAVQVIENCTCVAEYTEDVTTLKAQICNVLKIAGEPTKEQKEALAGKMRRLMESIVNELVFNNQRNPYKQRKQNVSEFDAFKGVRPLTESEVDELKELYAKLSIAEHDDPRNAYVNTPKAVFQARYDRIIAVETALLARR